MSSAEPAAILDGAQSTLALLGAPLGYALLIASVVVFGLAVTRLRREWLRPALAVLGALLVFGEGLLVWFHWRLWEASALVDPRTGATTGRIFVAPWTESEKLYVWALILVAMTLLARRHAREMEPYLGGSVSALTVGAVLIGRPFTHPLPDFLASLKGYLAAQGSGNGPAWFAAFQQLDSMRRYYYDTWYMWVHPPLLFFCYGAFVVSFAAVVLMLRERRAAYETTAYRWARLGYLPLTIGMLLGFPWALMSWRGEAWWWSGKVDMSILLWLLYTAYLHGRLYLRREGMWKWVAVLAVLSFVALVLTYLTTYVVPGAHSVAG
ncbi:MAG TPA: cytochrome c biogenesis protein CcsA [Coriobacteriia bacterium]